MKQKHPLFTIFAKICKGLQKENGCNVLYLSTLQPFFVFLRFCICLFECFCHGLLAIFQRQRNEAFVISTILSQLMRLVSSVGMWKSGCPPV